MTTVAEMADRVFAERKATWDRTGANAGITAANALGPEDERTVRRVVAEAGYGGAAPEVMVRDVSEPVVAKVEAIKDKVPADGAD
jgi:hypothetical protein